MSLHRPRLGLRSRASVAFAAVGLSVAVVLAGSTLLLSTRYLSDQRESAALRQAYANARLARSALRAANVDIPTLIVGLGGETGSTPILRVREEFFAGSVGAGRALVPDSLLAIVASGHAAHQQVRGPDGALQLVVGVALPAVDAAYFEVFPLHDLEQTLATLRSTLLIAALVTAALGALVGRYAAGRVVRPLEPVAAAAQEIAGGALATRLPEVGDPDLRPLTTAFNEMAASLEDRVARDARFASDVSHELRSPLAVLAASVDLIDRRRDDLPPTVTSAFDHMRVRIDEFQTLVLELLEISRLDNKAARLDLEPVEIRVFLTHLLGSTGADAELLVDDEVPGHVLVDRRRLAQALVNVVDNARRYAGGTTRCRATITGDELVIELDDNGPGIDPAERSLIFDRFARGSAGRRAGASSGTGLGLALTAEHVKLHGGRIEVTDSPEGGARFQVLLPLRTP